ncbi:uncharacterized protein FIBRA_02446 [Fibroporia radiculosa]|uniref:Rho-GAP domain-containing protein n=1 Tax=Fibroporia radiculosa TaxID=599839 RepID=J4I924_9APHY|nr:uncharacterized protein FIBRA_02446 [Fibroporia radiculosa]CCM00416.1 predicted protein [Fibroporia radiculosa]
MHYTQALARSRDGHTHASSSSSLSSAAPSELLHAAPPSNSSQSDLATDISFSSVSSSSSNVKHALPGRHHRFFPLLQHRSPSASSPSPSIATRSGSMGQSLASFSTPAQSSRPSSPSGAGGRFKRAWASRKKKSEDASSILTEAGSVAKGRQISRDSGAASASTSDLSDTQSYGRPQLYSQAQPPSSLPSGSRSARNLAPSSKLGVFGVGKRPRTPDLPLPDGLGRSSPPPPPPPKESNTKVTVSASASQRSLRLPVVEDDAIPSARRLKDNLPSLPSLPSSSTSPSPSSAIEKLKEDWRKSDSTMTSHITVRPGTFTGNRSPRPVSLAESNHSGNTIVPGMPVNKRLSALITDSEFRMVEEGPGSDEDEDNGVTDNTRDSEGESLSRLSSRELDSRRVVDGQARIHTATDHLKARNRRSMSLNFGPGHALPIASKSESIAQALVRPPSTVGHPLPGKSMGDRSLPGPSLSTTISRDTPTLTRAAASGIIAPLNAAGSQHTTGSNIKNRLAAWTSASAGSTPIQTHPNRPLPPAPVQAQHWRRAQNASSTSSQHAPPSFRQTAVSMTGSLAPAAGLAVGFGKRVVGKVVGKAWGGLSSSSSSASASAGSVQSSSTSSIASSDHGHGFSLGRTVSKESSSVLSYSTAASANAGKKSRRRAKFGHAPSVASSITSSSAASDIDGLTASGPVLGRRLRGPRRNSQGVSIIGGLVFKRDLQTCVADTAIDGIFQRSEGEEQGMRILTERRLPALIVRCSQHLLRWGLQEEGLFRVSGRSSHVARLRSEFDAGSDWDMVDSDPSDLDPHAVASIFKTYLRELPENILTKTLIPYFESALAAEDEASSGSVESADKAGQPSAPSHNRSGSALALRKAPSLSTLAVPSFAGRRSVSESLLSALTWLIAQLPTENRDLLYTVVELIRATAANSKETKMPLGNLLLVFCPSLNMNPTLLRVLCEHEVIWHGIPKTEPIPMGPSEPQEDDVDIRATFVTAPESRLSIQDAVLSGEELATEDESSAFSAPDDDNVVSVQQVSGMDIVETSVANHTVQVVSMETTDEEHCQVQANSQKKAEDPAIPSIDLVLLPPISPVSPVSLKDDSASFFSALEPPLSTPTRTPSPISRNVSGHSGFDGETSPPALPPLSSSTESLSSPSESSEEPTSPGDKLSTRLDGDSCEDRVSKEEESRKPQAHAQASLSQDSLDIPDPHHDCVLVQAIPVPSTEDVKITIPLDKSSSTTVPFPSSGGSSPDTPISHRKSFAFFSFPSLRSDPGTSHVSVSASAFSTPVGPPSSWHRPQRPSLHLLLRKLSGSSSGIDHSSVESVGCSPAMASVPALPTVYGTSQAKSAAASVPALGVMLDKGRDRSDEDRGSSMSEFAPKLNTSISSSPIQLGFGEESAEVPTTESRNSGDNASPSTLAVPAMRIDVDESASPMSSTSEPGPKAFERFGGHTRSRTESFAPSLYTTPLGTTPQTPIADLYQNYSRSKSAMSFFNDVDRRLGADADTTGARHKDRDETVRIMARSRSEASQVSVTPSLELSVDHSQDDWAESVLLAAQGQSVETKSERSNSNGTASV